MKSIGRNDPCPCGSGKKYKKCCLNSTASTALSQNLERILRQPDRWSFGKIEAMSTNDIVAKLKSFGIAFDEQQFQSDVRSFLSASELSMAWRKRFTVTSGRFDDDFIWMACTVLWKRLAPDVVSTDQIDNLMQQGYDHLEIKGEQSGFHTVEACKLWLQSWELLKQRFLDNAQSIADVDRKFMGSILPSNWCQDLEMELHNAGREDLTFFEKRIQYCHEFYTRLPQSSELIIHNTRRGEAESYFAVGQKENGDKAFEQLIHDYPDNPWGYIGWGDMYHNSFGGYKLTDYDRAEAIFRMALDRVPQNHEDYPEINHRLELLHKSRINKAAETVTEN